jgi:hypothetical protein
MARAACGFGARLAPGSLSGCSRSGGPPLARLTWRRVGAVHVLLAFFTVSEVCDHPTPSFRLKGTADEQCLDPFKKVFPVIVRVEYVLRLQMPLILSLTNFNPISNPHQLHILNLDLDLFLLD